MRMLLTLLLCSLLTACAMMQPSGLPGASGRVDFYNAKSQRIGYGVQQGDGSWSVYRTNGQRMGTGRGR